MEEQEPPQEAELSYGHISTLGSPNSLISVQPDPHMRFADHTDIIGPVANGRCYNLCVISFDQPHHVSFLRRRCSTTDDCFTGLGDLHEKLLLFIV